MDETYKRKIRKLRNMLNNNKKEVKKMNKKIQNNCKLKNICLTIISGTLVLYLISIILPHIVNLPLSFKSILEYRYILFLFPLLPVESGYIFGYITKNSVKKEKKSLEEKSEDYRKEIQNLHYFNLEKQRNNVIKENKDNKLIAIEKQKELLMDYKTRINGIYNGDIPKKIDEEIEYLNDKIYTLKKVNK